MASLIDRKRAIAHRQAALSVRASIASGIHEAWALRAAGHTAEAIGAAVDAGMIVATPGMGLYFLSSDCGARPDEPGARDREKAIPASGAAMPLGDQLAAIDAEIARCAASNEPSLREFAYDYIQGFAIGEEWLTCDLDEPEPPAWPEFFGLTLRNGSEADRTGYLLFTGPRNAALAACRELGQMGVASAARPHGGIYTLKIELRGAGALVQRRAA